MDNNKKQIASQIGKKIDVFAYFMDSNNARMNSNIQKIFERLNNWTMGNIWSNLVIVYPRFTRSVSNQYENAMKDLSKPKNLEKNFQEIKSFLAKEAVENNWNLTTVNDKGVESVRSLHESDFEKIRYSQGFPKREKA